MYDWQAVYKDNSEHRVDIVKAVLEDGGFLPVKVNKKDAYGLGNYELFVAPDHILQVIKVIKEEIKFE